jgi:chromosome partitioning protein
VRFLALHAGKAIVVFGASEWYTWGVKILAVVGYKGGTGKTTVAVNLADVIGERVPTVLIDTDPQGSASAWLGGKAEHLRVENIPEVGALERVLSQEWDGLVVVDGRPGDPKLTATAIKAADLTLLPLRPSPLDLHANAPILEQLGSGGVNGLAVICMATPRTQDAELMRATLGDQYNVRCCKTVLHQRVVQARAPMWQLGVCDVDPGGAASAEVLALAKEIRKTLGV